MQNSTSIPILSAYNKTMETAYKVIDSFQNTVREMNVTNDNITNATNNTTESYHNAINAFGFNATQVNGTYIFNHIPKYDMAVMIMICVILSVMILATILGNVFVISAVILERSLQGVSNYLILSLAVTDLLVAIFVMPLSLVKEISVHWYLGNEVCDFWISMDVLCCTASILHLVAISLDRFWGVSNIDYIRRRCAKQILFMVMVVWVVAGAISIPPLFGWKDSENIPEQNGVCMISQDLGYTVFSTVGAFYFPLVLMVVLNFKIYVAARTRIRKKNFVGRNKPVTSTFTNAETKTLGRSSSCSDISQEGYTVYNGSIAATCMNEESNNMQYSEGEGSGQRYENEYLQVPTPQSIRPIYYNKSNGHVTGTTPVFSTRNQIGNTHDLVGHTVAVNAIKLNENNNHKHDLLRKKKKRRDADKKRKDKLEMKRERKAAKVLGIITGAFIACWLPFFVLAVLAPFCGQHCNIPESAFSFFLWLGYFNSSLNPILYTIFNPSFRKAFHKIIYGKYRLR